jgi:hypothetical protein
MTDGHTDGRHVGGSRQGTVDDGPSTYRTDAGFPPTCSAGYLTVEGGAF